jgi:chromate reductase, NAD(P)H dehydrogenase (quinone)
MTGTGGGSGEAALRVLAFAGSLRKASFNRALTRGAREVAPDGINVVIHELEGIPLFNQDVEEQGLPDAVHAFHRAIAEADALLIATPEYQHGVSGVLKNAIDWASRPPGEAPILAKPVAIMGATPGMWGTARAQAQLRQALVYNGCPMVLKPEVLVANARERFDAEGRLTHDATRKFVRQLLESLAELTRRHAGPAPGT